MSPHSFRFLIGIDATHLSELQVYDLAKAINKNSNGFILQVDGTPNLFHGSLIVKCESEAEHSIVNVLRQSLTDIKYPYTIGYSIAYINAMPESGSMRANLPLSDCIENN